MQEIAEAIVVVAGLYLGAGAIFAVPFVVRGVGRVDPAARDASRGFRLIIVPGVIALWPLLLRRWIAGVPPPEERNTHRDAAGQGRT